MSNILSDQILDQIANRFSLNLNKEELAQACRSVLASIADVLQPTNLPAITQLFLTKIREAGAEELLEASVAASKSIGEKSSLQPINNTALEDEVLKSEVYPVLMAFFLKAVGQSKASHKLSPAQMAELLRSASEGETSGPYLQALIKELLMGLMKAKEENVFKDIIGRFLDADDDGSIMDDLTGMTGGILGGLFGQREGTSKPSRKSASEFEDKAPPRASAAPEEQEVQAGTARGLSDPPTNRSLDSPPAPAHQPKAEDTKLNQNIYSGFSQLSDPKLGLDSNQSLKCGTDYLFWLEISEEEVQEAVDVTILRISSDKLEAGEKLMVVLYTYDDQFQLDELADVGELEVKANKRLAVARQPMADFQLEVGALADRRLFFPVKTGDLEGVYRLDCHLYYKNMLVQARSIRALVKKEVLAVDNALGGAEMEYRLASLLSSDHLKKMIDDPEAQQKLSINLNESAGSHNFQFFGQGQFKKGVTFGENEIDAYLDMARNALRKVSWGSSEEPASHHDWSKTPYQYKDPINLEKDDQRLKFTKDLAWLAREGFRIYDGIARKLDPNRKEQFESIMKTPGYIQVALKQGARTIMPFAMIYDYLIDTGLNSDEFKLCESFLAAWKKGEDFKDIACFKGACPHQNIPINDTICPSGFWGFRHFLGFPHSVGENVDTPVAIEFAEVPSFLMAVSTDKNFKMLPNHKIELEQILDPVGWIYTENRNDTIRTFAKKETQPHLVYFYCHGGYVASDKKPYLQLGDPETDRIFTPDQIMASRANWSKTTPLVFLNGCHTTGLNTGILMDFVGSFVQNAHSAGVIGTEITIFEPLATAFAQAFFGRFLAGEPAGKAIRNARLDLLKQGNPLGLAYVPYLMPGLRMIQTAG